VLTIVAFSTERYLAICQPIHSYTTSSPRIALKVIAVLWCVSLLSATPFAIYTKINYVEYPPGTKIAIKVYALDQWYSTFFLFMYPQM
jgi:hypothetical protein